MPATALDLDIVKGQIAGYSKNVAAVHGVDYDELADLLIEIAAKLKLARG